MQQDKTTIDLILPKMGRFNLQATSRTKVRQRRKWFSRKYYASVMNIKEFFEDNIGKSFTGIISNALNKNFGRNH